MSMDSVEPFRNNAALLCWMRWICWIECRSYIGSTFESSRTEISDSKKNTEWPECEFWQKKPLTVGFLANILLIGHLIWPKPNICCFQCTFVRSTTEFVVHASRWPSIPGKLYVFAFYADQSHQQPYASFWNLLQLQTLVKGLRKTHKFLLSL